MVCPITLLLAFKNRTLKPREGVIIKCPLNGQYHDPRDVIITSRMAVSNNFVIITESDGLEMMMSEKCRSEAVNNGRLLFNFGNNGDKRQIISKIYLTRRSRLRRDR